MASYAGTLDEAKSLYEEFRSLDPFQQIAPALLNSADIKKYVQKTGMLFPFEEGDAKAASYRINLLGKYVLWAPDGSKKVGYIDRSSTFPLPSNSIAFVTLEPFIQLPIYIAARFNLTVKNVYRGLLLGTGPQIDPGWAGRLSIPLHNFTTNEYVLIGGDHLISMEFTKVSPDDSWLTQNANSSYVEYDVKKKLEWDVEKYLWDADPHRPIMSSIPNAIHAAEAGAKKAEKWTRIVTISGLGLGLAALVALWSTIYNAYDLYGQAVAIVRNAQETIQMYKKPTDSLLSLRQNVNQIRLDLQESTASHRDQVDSLSSLQKRVAALTDEIEKLKRKTGK